MSPSSIELEQLLQQLQSLQMALVDELKHVGPDYYQKQYHDDLSPLGWHVGHCVYTENYWIREQWLNIEQCDEALKQLYIPELSQKKSRGSQLPGFDQLSTWATENQEKNLTLIKQNIHHAHELIEKHFLIRFLIQHYCQHLETVAMIRQSKQLTEDHQRFPVVSNSNLESLSNSASVSLASGEYPIGSSPSDLFFYDNERPRHNKVIKAGNFAIYPVSNYEYLTFMHAEGYQDKQYWTEAGWQWLTQHTVNMPYHWLSHNDNFFEVTDKGVINLRLDHLLYGISYYEAEAYARFANARLPTEFQWEAAANLQMLKQTGVVWEWCANHFAPYPGFIAYPYDGYSVPYFDQQHFVLKGGSQHSHNIIKRSSFRNYYQADKRHIFAGVRLMFD